MTVLAEQRTITRRLLRRIVLLWPALDPLNLAATWPAVLRALVPLVVDEHRAAGDAAVAAYMAQRAAEAATAAQAVLFNPVPAEMDAEGLRRVRTSLTVTGPVALQRSLNRGVPPARAGKAALVQVQGAATRHVLGGARDTTLAAVEQDPAALGWARTPRPDACPFCLLLATRGDAYRSRETALRTTIRSARGAGQSYHDHCRCAVEPIFTDDWQPPEHVARAQRIYEDSTAGKSGAAARKAFADAVTADRQQTTA